MTAGCRCLVVLIVLLASIPFGAAARAEGVGSLLTASMATAIS